MNNQWRHYADISQCPLCPLKGQDYALSRIHRRTGKKVMFIGEAPGEEEAKQHIAFVGRSGKLLDKWIEYLGIDNYVITNVVRHRPPNNRLPRPTEIQECIPYLIVEIENEHPDYVVCLGRVAANSLYIRPEGSILIYNSPLWTMVGSDYSISINQRNYKLTVLYHPSYILRSGKDMTPYLDKLKARLEMV